MKYRPLNNRVMLNIVREETKSKAGIILTIEKEGAKTQFAKVVAVAKDVEDIKVGDKVMYDKFSGLPLDDDNIMIDANDIIAIVEKEE